MRRKKRTRREAPPTGRGGPSPWAPQAPGGAGGRCTATDSAGAAGTDPPSTGAAPEKDAARWTTLGHERDVAQRGRTRFRLRRPAAPETAPPRRAGSALRSAGRRADAGCAGPAAAAACEPAGIRRRSTIGRTGRGGRGGDAGGPKVRSRDRGPSGRYAARLPSGSRAASCPSPRRVDRSLWHGLQQGGRCGDLASAAVPDGKDLRAWPCWG